MPTYVAFLRAINLGARRRFPKDDIRRVVQDAGFDGVETHINTGNVRIVTRMRSRARIEAALEAAFLADRGFDVPTVVFGTAELAAVAADAEALAAEPPGVERHYVDLLRTEPPGAARATIEAAASDGVRLVVRGRAVHTLVTAASVGPGPVSAPLARLLGVSTNRNATVVVAVARRWC